MWTVRKVKVAIGDAAGARVAARYPLEPADSPRAFGPGGGEDGDPQAVAHWLGSDGALSQLGLRRGQAVEREQLALVLQGRHVDGSQVRRPGFIHKQVRDDSGRPMRWPDGEPVLER